MIDKLYDALLGIADPKTGRVSLTGEMAGGLIGMKASAGRLYIGELVRTGKLTQLSDIKRGTTTLYRIPAMCRGDVRTLYEERTVKAEPVKAEPVKEEPLKMEEPVLPVEVCTAPPEPEEPEAQEEPEEVVTETQKANPYIEEECAAFMRKLEAAKATAVKSQLHLALEGSDRVYSEVLSAFIDLRKACRAALDELERK